MFYTIYKTTNIINNKFYIGKHKTKDLNDGYLGSGKLLKRSIKKHGVNNFDKEILHLCKDEKHMNLLEKILVVPDKETNYNLCEGGKGGWSYINSIGMNNLNKNWTDTKKKMSLSATGKKRPSVSKMLRDRHENGLIKYDTFTGKKHNENTKKKISLIMKEKQKGTLNSQYNTCWITNGDVNKKIKREDLVFWLELGYNKGRKI